MERPKKNKVQSSLHDSIATTLTPSMHAFESSAISPTPELSIPNPPLDIRQLYSLPITRDPAKPQEQGNTKKKRRSLPGIENTLSPSPTQEHSPISDSPESRPSAFGDPMKIAQYFPELN